MLVLDTVIFLTFPYSVFGSLSSHVIVRWWRSHVLLIWHMYYNNLHLWILHLFNLAHFSIGVASDLWSYFYVPIFCCTMAETRRFQTTTKWHTGKNSHLVTNRYSTGFFFKWCTQEGHIFALNFKVDHYSYGKM